MSDPFTPATAATRRPLLVAMLVFLCAALVVGSMVWLSEQGRLREQRAAAADLSGDHAHAIQRDTERTLAATYALAALVRQGQGNIPNFTATAREMLPFYPGAASLQLAPGGIVQHIVPLAGNEKAIGHNLLADPRRDKEAFRARDTGQLTLAGPFQLVQGGLGAVGRLPVFLDDSQGNPSFWGFTSVLIRFPEALKEARLVELEKQGFGYELWRMHPDTGQKQPIASSSASTLIDPVTRGFDMPNGSWNLSIAPLKGWGDPLGLALKSALGLLFCLLLAYLARLLLELKSHKQRLQVLVAQRTQQLSSSEQRYRGVFENAADAILLISLDGRVRDANPKACAVYGYPHDEFVGLHGSAFVHPQHAWKFGAALAAIQAGKNFSVESVDFKKGGQPFPIEVHISPFNHLGEAVLLCTIRDISDRRAAEAKIQSLSQLYAALSRSNQAIVHCTSEAELFERICKDVVQFGGLKMAWIGLLDAASGWIIPVASFGEGVDYLRDLRVLVDPEDPLGQGPIGISIREDRPYWCQDFLGDPLTLPWRESAAQYHWAACATLPLHRAGAVTGVFTLYTSETQAFEEDVRNLLLEMASDISFALDGFDRETRRQQSEERLRLAASVFTHSREAIMITAVDGAIIDVNEAFSRITGYSRDEVLGQNPRILNSGRQSREHYTAMWRALFEQGHWYGEIWNRRKNGEVYAEMQTISSVRDPQGKVQQYVSLFSDITQLKEHESQLERIAHFDALTGLPNRVLLSDRLHQGMAQALRRGQRLAVAFLDIDGFKAVNDSRGHETGDQLLIALAARMKQALREGDSLARLGGDEFVAVLIDLPDIEASVPMLGRLLAAAAQPVRIGDNLLQVSASLGVTFYPQAEEVDADQLLRQADQAMYQAKLAGKNRYHVFDAEQDRSVRGHHESLERIRQALLAREFVLHYQPKVNMRSGAVIGVEALIRWQHPERGLLSPAVFLPVIEDHALAVDIGEWVIDTALSQMALWRAAALDLPISVNVGARQLQQPDFVPRLRVLLAAHPEVKATDLELEVLETSALEDVARVSGVIEACREIGVMFALDDFGTGYSSLTYLKRLPVALLKIDQSFVRDMLDDPDDLSILEGVIGLATAFRRKVIAEGVETVAHGALLLQLGCELAQGYGIARPMPAHAVPGWLATWRPDPAWSKLSPVDGDDLPVLFAAVEHRAWVAGVEAFLDGRRDAPPPLAPDECRFGQWLKVDGRARHGTAPGFPTIDALHRQAHALALALCQDPSGGPGAPSQERLGELHQLRDDLIEQLIMLVQGPRRQT